MKGLTMFRQKAKNAQLDFQNQFQKFVLVSRQLCGPSLYKNVN